MFLCIYHGGKMKLPVYKSLDVLTQIMFLTFILKLFIFEGLVSVRCLLEISTCLIFPVAPDSLSICSLRSRVSHSLLAQN